MSLKLENINIFNKEVSLFKKFSLEVNSSKILTLMGPSGSGKSTLLSFICGALNKNDFDYNGKIYLNNKDISHLPIQKRNIGILFQDDLLFPHMNVEENLLFALPAKMKKYHKKEKIDFFLNTAQLKNFGKRRVQTLSGGQKARINLLRALLAEPQALLLDEPFSKLDEKLKIEIKNFVFGLIKKLNIPTILVTHNKEDIPQKSKEIIFI